MDAGVSARQAEIFLAVAEAGSYRAAGAKLGIAEQSVKNQMSAVLSTLRATSSLQAYHRLMKGVRIIVTARMEDS